MQLPLYDRPDAFRVACDEARKSGHRVGFVPTMGALHDGHFRLVEEAARRADFVVVSIFVNPTQFGPNEDYAKYPRTLERDMEGCARAGGHGVFAPSPSDMYPKGEQTRVRVGGLSEWLCGKSRPGHFDGVATVVAKLFALAGPCVAVFGRKDYQQLKIIERLARDLFFSVDVVGISTVREPDGLAMSSRNAYLSADQRVRARSLSRGLSHAVRAFEAGERKADVLRQLASAQITAAVDSIDYIEVSDPDTLAACGPNTIVGDRALVAVAVRVGPARLIDNVVLGEDAAPTGVIE